MKDDPDSKVACETCTKTGMVGAVFHKQKLIISQQAMGFRQKDTQMFQIHNMAQSCCPSLPNLLLCACAGHGLR